MRSLITAIADWSVQSKLRKRQQLKEQSRDQQRTVWNARLPPSYYGNNRSLTGGEVDVGEVHAQLQSPFFAKLPIEIRCLIYGYALGRSELRLELIGNEKSDSESTPFQLKCLQAQAPNFLRSCKLASIEATKYFYSENTFYFPNTTSFFLLQRLVPTRDFHQIQSLHLRWAYFQATKLFDFLNGAPPYDSKTWTEIWFEIANMENLKEVQVDVVVYAPFVRPEYEKALLSPIATCQEKVESLRVRVSWECRDTLTDQNAGNVWPFMVERGVVSLA